MTVKTELTREQWLTIALHQYVAPLLAEKAGVTVPTDALVSCGFPGGGSARKRIGECWTRMMSSTGVNELFISPKISDNPAKMLDVLVHEAIHAADDCQSGHKGFFRKAATAVGLEGKMTSTHAGPELAKWIADTLAKLPKITHSKLDLSSREKKKTYLLKIECPACGCTLRGTATALGVGLPTCGCGTDMVLA